MRMIVAICGVLWCAGAAQAQIHKCIGAGGKTEYSQVPCPKNTRSTTIQGTAPAPVPAPAAKAGEKGDAAAKAPAGPKTAAELDQDFRKRRQDQEEERKKQGEALAEAKIKDENCRGARSTLANLESGTRQVRLNEKGEQYILEDAQIEGEKARARAAVQSWCK